MAKSKYKVNDQVIVVKSIITEDMNPDAHNRDKYIGHKGKIKTVKNTTFLHSPVESVKNSTGYYSITGCTGYCWFDDELELINDKSYVVTTIGDNI
jgi:hypothetical protein